MFSKNWPRGIVTLETCPWSYTDDRRLEKQQQLSNAYAFHLSRWCGGSLVPTATSGSWLFRFAGLVRTRVVKLAASFGGVRTLFTVLLGALKVLYSSRACACVCVLMIGCVLLGPFAGVGIPLTLFRLAIPHGSRRRETTHSFVRFCVSGLLLLAVNVRFDPLDLWHGESKSLLRCPSLPTKYLPPRAPSNGVPIPGGCGGLFPASNMHRRSGGMILTCCLR